MCKLVCQVVNEGMIAEQLSAARPSNHPKIEAAIAEALGRPERPAITVRHRPPESFQRRQPVELALSGPVLTSAVLHYRHVNQAERWQSIPMNRGGATYLATIPSAYTDSPYPLQYYFELKSAPERSCLHPGFPADLAGQPYYVIRGE